MSDYQLDNERRLSNLENGVRENKESIVSIKSDVKDLDSVYEIIMEITKNTSILASKMEQMQSNVESIKCDLREMRNKPLEEAMHYKRVILGAILLAAISFIIGQII